MNAKNFLVLIFLMMMAISLKAQDTIVLKENPISEQTHGIYLLSSHHRPNSYPLKKSKKQYSTYPYGIGTNYFKSLIVDNNKIGIELTASGKKRFYEQIRLSEGDTLAYIFADTITQLRKIDKTLIDSSYFVIENLSQNEKEKIVNYYRSLPSEKIQKDLQYSLRKHNFRKADSLLSNGAFIMKKLDQRRVYYDAYDRRDTLLINYFKKIDYTQRADNIYDAIDIEDKNFIRSYFNNIKNKPEFQQKLNSRFIDAADHSSKEIVELLLNYGADLNYKRRGYTALTFAAGYGEIEVFDFLISQGLIEDDIIIFFVACQSNNQFMIDHLLKKGYDINMQDDDGFSVLHYLLHEGLFDSAFLLINKGIDVNLVDNNGNTALHKLSSLIYEKSENHTRNFGALGLQSKYLIRIANSLIEHGVDLNIKNKNGFTALELAKGAEGVPDEYKIRTNNELVEILKKY